MLPSLKRTNQFQTTNSNFNISIKTEPWTCTTALIEIIHGSSKIWFNVTQEPYIKVHMLIYGQIQSSCMNGNRYLTAEIQSFNYGRYQPNHFLSRTTCYWQYFFDWSKGYYQGMYICSNNKTARTTLTQWTFKVSESNLWLFEYSQSSDSNKNEWMPRYWDYGGNETPGGLTKKGAIVPIIKHNVSRLELWAYQMYHWSNIPKLKQLWNSLLLLGARYELNLNKEGFSTIIALFINHDPRKYYLK